MIHALYTDSGELVGVTNSAPIAFPGISIKQLDVCPDLNVHVWDAELIDFVRSDSKTSKKEFLEKFTLAERLSIRASTDSIVQDLMFLLDAATYIDMKDSSLIIGVNYLASINIIAQNRVQEILGN